MQVRLYAEDPGKDFQPAAGVLTEVVFPGGCARRNLGRARQRGAAFLRPDGGEDHRQGPRPRRGAEQNAAGAGRTPASPASRPTSATCAQIVRDAVFMEGRQTTRYLNAFHYRPHDPRRHRARRAEQHPGLAGPHSATGTSACRRRDRWMRWPCASPTALPAMRKARPGWNSPSPARRCASTATR